MTKAFAGATNLPDRIQNLIATDANGNSLKIWKGQSGAWWIHAKELIPRNVKLSYQIDASGTAEVTSTGEPLLNRDYGFFFGHALFITPEISHRYHPKVTVEFNVPKSRKIATTWGFKQQVYQPDGLWALKDSIIALGDYRVYPEQLLNKQIAFAIRDSDLATAKELDKFLNKYQEHLAVLFANASLSPALVVLNRGIGEMNGFSQVSNGIVITLRDLKNLNAKQAWDVYLNEALIPDNVIEPWNAIHAIKPENAKRSKWFSEGFAEYHRQIGSLGQLSLDVLNRLYTIYGYQREISVVESGRDTGRGVLIALILDWKIRRHSEGKESLDDLMRAMYQRFGPLTQEHYTNEDILQIASELTGENLSNFYLKYVLGTDELPLAEYLDELGFYIEEQLDDICDLGMTLKQQKDGYLVTEVAKGGPAEQSGFVAGDLITGEYNVFYRTGYAIAVDSNEQFAAKFSTNNKFITFYTSRGTRILNPQIKPDGVYVRRIVAK
jgi:predicted metalloprotease with PDZ domain